MTLRASGHSCRGSLRAPARDREPAHVAVLSGGEELGQPLACLGAEFGAAEADRVEAKREGALADQCLRISGAFPGSSDPRPRYGATSCGGIQAPSGGAPVCQNTSIGMPPRGYQ